MALELIAAVIAAVGMGGIALGLRKMTRNALPSWIVPVFAGVGLLSYAIWSEYDWFRRVSTGLPEGVVVAWQAEEPTALRPWTFVFPFTNRFVAVDTRGVVQHPQAQNLAMARTFTFARWQPTRDGFLVVDCEGHRQVPLVDGMEITDEGELKGAEWISVPADDAFQQVVCRKG